jgi:hypothetical protein
MTMVIEVGEQLSEEGFVLAPAPHRALVEELAYLHVAYRPYRTFRTVKVEATRVKRKAAVGKDAARRAFDIGHDVLVVYIEDSTRGQHTVPMRHQIL